MTSDGGGILQWTLTQDIANKPRGIKQSSVRGTTRGLEEDVKLVSPKKLLSAVFTAACW